MNEKSIDYDWDEIYIAIGSCSWGIGDNPYDAYKNAKSSESIQNFQLAKLPSGAYGVRVGDLGDVFWRWKDGADTSKDLVGLKIENKLHPYLEDDFFDTIHSLKEITNNLLTCYRMKDKVQDGYDNNSYVKYLNDLLANIDILDKIEI